MRNITGIVLHCSASDNPRQGTEQMIRLLHTLPTDFKIDWGEYKDVSCKGWQDIGYHVVIEKSGRVMSGRFIGEGGAHVKGFNKGTIGICLVGDKEFTYAQFRALAGTVHALCQEYKLDVVKDVYHHRDFTKEKTCPNFDWSNVWNTHKGDIYHG